MNSWEVSTAPMCRACMEIDGTFVPMDDGSPSKKNLLRKLVDLTSIEVNSTSSDKLSLNIPKHCAESF